MPHFSKQPQYHVELIDGREIEKPLPKKLHVFIQRHLIVELARLLPHGEAALISLAEMWAELD